MPTSSPADHDAAALVEPFAAALRAGQPIDIDLLNSLLAMIEVGPSEALRVVDVRPPEVVYTHVGENRPPYYVLGVELEAIPPHMAHYVIIGALNRALKQHHTTHQGG